MVPLAASLGVVDADAAHRQFTMRKRVQSTVTQDNVQHSVANAMHQYAYTMQPTLHHTEVRCYFAPPTIHDNVSNTVDIEQQLHATHAVALRYDISRALSDASRIMSQY